MRANVHQDGSESVDRVLGHAGLPVFALADCEALAALDVLLSEDIQFNAAPNGLHLLLDLDGEPALRQDLTDDVLQRAPIAWGCRYDYEKMNS